MSLFAAILEDELLGRNASGGPAVEKLRCIWLSDAMEAEEMVPNGTLITARFPAG